MGIENPGLGSKFVISRAKGPSMQAADNTATQALFAHGEFRAIDVTQTQAWLRLEGMRARRGGLISSPISLHGGWRAAAERMLCTTVLRWRTGGLRYPSGTQQWLR